MVFGPLLKKFKLSYYWVLTILCIFWMIVLSDVSFVFFFPVLWLLLILLTLSFAEQFLILMKSCWSIFFLFYLFFSLTGFLIDIKMTKGSKYAYNFTTCFPDLIYYELLSYKYVYSHNIIFNGYAVLHSSSLVMEVFTEFCCCHCL